ncbi:Abi family protein [Pseudomonas sp. NPDC089752]|uniref:Abi family protein n=1 Tax=Pseudomonas sp. NPDC089752 TaxID=3364472 RepID=UPI00381D6435
MTNPDWSQSLEQAFSKPRLARYAINPRKTKAATAYAHNMLLGQALYPCLHVLEISLRNSMHQALRLKYGRADWWEDATSFTAADRSEIEKARNAIKAKRHVVTPDKIVSDLSFGFWVSLLNTRHEHEFWKVLRLAFPRCPKQRRQRNDISKILNLIRDLRNRTAHHDALLWLQPDIRQRHMLCLEVIGWVDPDLKPWLTQYDAFPQAWSNWIGCTACPL